MLNITIVYENVTQKEHHSFQIYDGYYDEKIWLKDHEKFTTTYQMLMGHRFTLLMCRLCR